MPSADISYHQPSRGSRALVIGLSIGVVLLAAWIVTANLGSLYGPDVSGPDVSAVPDPEPTQAAEALTSAPADSVVAAPAIEAPAEEVVVTAETEPPVPEPVVVASADEATPLVNTVVAAIDPDVTGSTDATKFGPDEAVPLPLKRPQLKMTAALPVPRPRPDLGDTPVPTGRELTEAEIERMR